ncbi:MAG: hypothetical protein KAY24_00050 [Candidatus Eisenbacteria sp.]|nr:hypothetical protein [Candidatus Eisenbacteria bacterium]
MERRQLLRDILALVDASSRAKAQKVLSRQERWMEKYPDDTEIEDWGEMLAMLVAAYRSMRREKLS